MWQGYEGKSFGVGAWWHLGLGFDIDNWASDDRFEYALQIYLFVICICVAFKRIAR